MTGVRPRPMPREIHDGQRNGMNSVPHESSAGLGRFNDEDETDSMVSRRWLGLFVVAPPSSSIVASSCASPSRNCGNPARDDCPPHR